MTPKYIQALTGIHPKRRPPGFYQEVKNRLGNVKVPSSTLSMVKSGRRENDAILMAIIETDHELQHGKTKL